MDRNGWTEYLKKQRLQDLKSLAKQLGIYIKSNTKKSDCIDIILNNSPETPISSNNFNFGLRDKILADQQNFSSEASILSSISEPTHLNSVNINEYLHLLSGNNHDSACSMCQKGLSDIIIKCDACYRPFHSLCVGFDVERAEFNNNHMMVFMESISKKDGKNTKVNSINFICPFCRFFVIDPYNKIIKPLFFTTFYSYTAIHNIHPKYGSINFNNSSHLPHFTSKYSFSPTIFLNKDLESNESDKYNIMIYCLRLDRMDLNHEFPRILFIKANGKTIQNIESPSYDHIRRDCPLYLKDYLVNNQLIAKQNVNITFNTLNALLKDSENGGLLPIPTAPYIIGLFLTRTISCDNILDTILSESTLSIEISRAHFRNILENKIQSSIYNQSHDDSSDEIICLNKDQYLNTLCPLTMDTIELPGRGLFCNHINCFDIKAFIQINSTIKAFNTRWKCPLCYQIIRPSMLKIDSFVKMIVSNPNIPRENNKILINSGIFDRIEQNEDFFGELFVKTSNSIKQELPKVKSITLPMNEHLTIVKEKTSQNSDSPFSNKLKDCFHVQNEVINISDDDDEDAIIDDHFTINDDELNSLFSNSNYIDMNIGNINRSEHNKETIFQNYKEDSIPPDNRKKRKVSEDQFLSPNPGRPEKPSNGNKTSISLRI
ncbi:SAP+PHD+MIZ domains containing [Cryptosporidium sp. chipmunk genotype I]|uniref:SAP+PHD+MIZ domains containing n=1 Tax=Cryptosporidium sp. chipmunk genotype I TaxID=1280935 RepID=UPI00351A02B5|nr:SAP+PHD+MIZ domains containing [Cryptosporidium sp. chipmunk genotype I]